MGYLLDIVVLVEVFAILAISLDLVVGQTGILSVAHAAFLGLGAYSSALITARLGGPFEIGVLAGIAVSAFLSLLVSLPAARLRDEYLVIATFGFQMVLFSVFNNWIGLTEGPLGVSGIARPNLLGWEVRSSLSFATLGAGLVSLAYFIAARIAAAPIGRVLRAIREDETLARAVGKNTVHFKVTTFAVSAALAALAGSLYAHYLTYVSPASFTVMESILILSMVIIGGAGSRWGPVVGAAVLVVLPEALRFVGIPSAVAANVRQILYGAALVGFMLWRPQGLLGEYTFQKGGSRA